MATVPVAVGVGGLGDSTTDHAFFGHPRGLSTLFFTEMWERFSYYGMRALLILFMTASVATGGLGFDAATAGAIYGTYTSMVYMMSLPGGWIADRIIGQRRAVLYGGIVIAAGHFSLAVPSIGTFYLGLVLIVLGTGLLKPNVSVIVGQLYSSTDQRRDAGFSVFYMGINLGAFLAPLVTGYLAQDDSFKAWLLSHGLNPTDAWHWGFGAAGVGMTLGVIQYALGGRLLGRAGLDPVPAASPAAFTALKRKALLYGGGGLGLLVAGGIGIALGILPITGAEVATAAGYLYLVVTVVFFLWLFLGSKWTAEERGRLIVIAVFFLASALFWSVFEQAGSTLNLFADRSTHNVILRFAYPSSWFQSLNSLFIIIFAPLFSVLWIRLGRREPTSPVKFSLGLIGVGAGFLILIPAATIAGSGALVSPMWLAVTYLLHTFAELCLSPVGLSSMTKLAPARIVGLMMGVWFLGTSVGNYIGGQLASLYTSFPLPHLFGVVGAFGVIAGVLLWLSARQLTRLMGGVR